MTSLLMRNIVKNLFKEKLPFILAILLYLLIYLVRLGQPAWDLKNEVLIKQRQFLDHKITEFLPTPAAELLSGILLGQNKDLPVDLKLGLRDTSTLHIVVASGQNLSLVAALFINLSGIIKRRNAILLSILAVILYTLLTGVQVPVLRAAVMAFAGYLGQALGKNRDGAYTLIVAAGLMLLLNPKWITDISFQLSFLATFGVIVVAPLFLRFFQKLPDVINTDLAVTLAAQVMVLPVIVGSFHQLSLVSVFANLFVLWTVPFIMILGAVSLLLSILVPPLIVLASIPANILLTYFVYIIQFFASLPFAWIYVGNLIWIVWVGYYLLIAALILSLKKRFAL